MGQALSYATRLRIIELRQNGKPFTSIASELGVSYSGVRKIWSRYKAKGESGLSASYANCGPPPTRFDPLIHRAACWLKRLHPDWGGPFILQILSKRYEDRYSLPHIRTLQRWLNQAGLIVRKRRAVSEPTAAAREAHQIWQIDAKEKVKLATGERICWVSVADEKTRSILDLKAFPPQRNLDGSP